ncbi:MAG TPA: CRISPR-associated endonuclease Cas2 [Ktedonobacterales bacterium]|nr:CRISPR-associated endonuclease Cas2 [Ktedonobacterales bacterium]
MDVLVTYDVTTETADGRRRLRKVADACLAFGQRVQQSVFECSLTEMQLEALRHRLLACIDEREDSLRIYRLPQPRERYLWTYGVRHEIDMNGPLIV